MEENDDLDISWITEQEKFQNIQNNYQREPMEFVPLYFIYINKNQYIDKILTEKFPLDNDLSIKREHLLKIIQEKKINTSFSKYKLIDILTYFVDLEPEKIQSFSNVENIEQTYSQFFKVLNIPDEINIPQSIFIFHNINSIYFIFQEVDVVAKHSNTIKSILKTQNREPLAPGSLKSTKKVRIVTTEDKKLDNKRQKLQRRKTRKLLPKTI